MHVYLLPKKARYELETKIHVDKKCKSTGTHTYTGMHIYYATCSIIYPQFFYKQAELELCM